MKNLMRNCYPCLSLHGGIDQYDRDSIISDFKNAITPLLIATSVAARGLDVKDLILVVNYDCPNHYEDYVHRCGRTGRAGNIGYAYTFLTPEQERYAGDLMRALETADAPIPEELQALWDGYAKKMEAMGKKVRKGGGFSGHGFKFDTSETQLKDEQKKMQKVVMGLGDSDEDEESQDVCEKMFFLKNILITFYLIRLINKFNRCSEVKNLLKQKVIHLFYQMHLLKMKKVDQRMQMMQLRN
jgi:ATP-dependent RNA helicase DDX46/PRP5